MPRGSCSPSPWLGASQTRATSGPCAHSSFLLTSESVLECAKLCTQNHIVVPTHGTLKAIAGHSLHLHTPQRVPPQQARTSPNHAWPRAPASTGTRRRDGTNTYVSTLGTAKPPPWVVSLRSWQHRKGLAEGRGCPHLPAGPDLPVPRNGAPGHWPFKHPFKVSSLK